MARWVALFSQTGSEIVELSKMIGHTPDYIYTNNMEISEWHNKVKVTFVSDHERIMQTLKESHRDDVITLHGYLRILPEDVVLNCNRIYNGHPGLISRYPELKGKDPQVRAVEYDYIGSVVHEVTTEVDEGKIISECRILNEEKTLDSVYRDCKKASLVAWYDVLEDLINE